MPYMAHDFGSYRANFQSGFEVLRVVLLKIQISGMLCSVIGYVVSDV